MRRGARGELDRWDAIILLKLNISIVLEGKQEKQGLPRKSEGSVVIEALLQTKTLINASYKQLLH
jgi:hypothetical protein